MTTKIFLIRHGMNDLIGNTIAGRMSGVHLNTQGRRQAEHLVRRLADESIDHIFTSPMERCLETAAPLAAQRKLEVTPVPGVLEIGYGEWTGRSVAELQKDPLWNLWNSFRTGTRVPGGETMLEIQHRVVAEIQRLRAKCQGQSIAVFSHGDPIKTAICFYLGIPLDFFQRIEISPASVSLLHLGDDYSKVQYFNDESATFERMVPKG
jgi:probable phosphomutase (TIGR03848 family)